MSNKFKWCSIHGKLDVGSHVHRFSTSDSDLMTFLMEYHGLGRGMLGNKSVLLCDGHFTPEGQQMGRIHNPMDFLLRENCGPAFTDSFSKGNTRRMSSSSISMDDVRSKAQAREDKIQFEKEEALKIEERRVKQKKARDSRRLSLELGRDAARKRLRSNSFDGDSESMKRNVSELMEEVQKLREHILVLQKQVTGLERALSRAEEDQNAVTLKYEELQQKGTVQVRGRLSLDELQDCCLFPTWTGFVSSSEYMELVGDSLNAEMKSHVDARFSPAELGIWFFAHFRGGLEINTIAKLVGVSQPYVSRRIEDLLLPIRCALLRRNLLHLPSPKELLNAMSEKQRLTYPGFIMLAADATPIPVWMKAPGADKRIYYATKYSKHVVRWTALVDSSGRFLAVTKVAKGSLNDKTAWDNCDINSQLASVYGESAIVDDKEYKFSIMGDKAYPVAQAPRGWFWHCTMTAAKKKAKATAVNGDRLVCDPNVAPYRAVVERSFGDVKRWAFLSHRAMHYNEETTILNELIEIAACIHNHRVNLHKLRSS